MFWDKIKKIFGANDKAGGPSSDVALRAMKETIREKRKSDPLIGPKICGRIIAQNLISGLKDERGVHMESILCALGSMAGYACQASLRELHAAQGGQNETIAFVIANGKDGKKYFFGDALNKPLAEDQYSVWSLAAGAATHHGCQKPLNIEEIFKHVAATVGGPEFGIPRVPEDNRPGDPPSYWIKFAWPKILITLKDICDSPAEWPIALGMSIQEVFDQAKGVIDPCLALLIVMESAVPMSKIDATTL